MRSASRSWRTLASSRTEGLRGDGDTFAAALTGGYHIAFVVAAGLVVTAIVVAVTVLRPGRAWQLADAEAAEPEIPQPAWSEAA